MNFNTTLPKDLLELRKHLADRVSVKNLNYEVLEFENKNQPHRPELELLLVLSCIEVGSFELGSQYLQKVGNKLPFSDELVSLTYLKLISIMSQTLKQSSSPIPILSQSSNLRSMNGLRLSTQEFQLLSILKLGPQHKIDIQIKLFGESLPLETGEIRLKNLIFRLRKKIPGCIWQVNGIYRLEGVYDI